MAVKDKKYYWLKLKRDFFKRHDIQIIESMPNGKDYILFYLKLLCESIDHEGKLRFNETIPYNEQMLAVITTMNVDVVRNAINIFCKLKMMEIMDDGTYYMREVNQLIGTETYWAQKKREQKAKAEEVGNFPTLSNNFPTCPSKSIEKKTEKETENNNELFLSSSGAPCESPVAGERVIADQDGEKDKSVLSESPATDRGVIADHSESMDKRNEHAAIVQREANALFDNLWKLYPNKRGKGKISDSKKRVLLEIGEEHMKRAIRRYIEEHDRKEKNGDFTPNWQHGSTFFNSGYVDYLDENYTEPQTLQKNIKNREFCNYEQSGTDWNAVAERVMIAQEEELEQ